MTARWGVWLVIAATALTALSAIFLVASGDGIERTLGVTLAGFTVLGTLVAWAFHRRPDPLVGAALWVVPGCFAGIALVIVANGAMGIAGYYGFLAVLSGVGVVVARAQGANL